MVALEIFAVISRASIFDVVWRAKADLPTIDANDHGQSEGDRVATDNVARILIA